MAKRANPSRGFSDGDPFNELVSELKRIFLALRNIIGADTRGERETSATRNRRIYRQSVRPRLKGLMAAGTGVATGSAPGVASGLGLAAAGPWGLAAAGVGAAGMAYASYTRYKGQVMAGLTTPGDVQSLRTAEATSNVVNKVTFGIGGGFLKSAWNITGYTDMQTSVSATRDDVLGLARSMHESGIEVSGGKMESVVRARFKKQKEWIKQRDRWLEEIEKVAGPELRAEKAEAGEYLSEQFGMLGNAINYVTEKVQNFGDELDQQKREYRASAAGRSS